MLRLKGVGFGLIGSKYWMVNTEFLLLVRQGHIGPVGALLPKLLNPMFYSFLVKGEGTSPPIEGTKKG